VPPESENRCFWGLKGRFWCRGGVRKAAVGGGLVCVGLADASCDPPGENFLFKGAKARKAGTMFKKQDKTQPEYTKLTAEEIAAIPNLHRCERAEAFGRRREEIEAAIRDADKALKAHRYRPGHNAGAPLATAQTIDKAARDFLSTGALAELGDGEDVVKSRLRNKLHILQEALKIHAQQGSRVEADGIRDGIPDATPTVAAVTADLVAAGMAFCDALDRQRELYALLRARGFRTWASPPSFVASPYEEFLMHGGSGFASLRQFVDMKRGQK